MVPAGATSSQDAVVSVIVNSYKNSMDISEQMLSLGKGV
jgi:hypothetical protein